MESKYDFYISSVLLSSLYGIGVGWRSYRVRIWSPRGVSLCFPLKLLSDLRCFAVMGLPLIPVARVALSWFSGGRNG